MGATPVPPKLNCANVGTLRYFGADGVHDSAKFPGRIGDVLRIFFWYVYHNRTGGDARTYDTSINSGVPVAHPRLWSKPGGHEGFLFTDGFPQKAKKRSQSVPAAFGNGNNDDLAPGALVT